MPCRLWCMGGGSHITDHTSGLACVRQSLMDGRSDADSAEVRVCSGEDLAGGSDEVGNPFENDRAIPAQ
jgi:hypothetical protein